MCCDRKDPRGVCAKGRMEGGGALVQFQGPPGSYASEVGLDFVAGAGKVALVYGFFSLK